MFTRSIRQSVILSLEEDQQFKVSQYFLIIILGLFYYVLYFVIGVVIILPTLKLRMEYNQLKILIPNSFSCSTSKQLSCNSFPYPSHVLYIWKFGICSPLTRPSDFWKFRAANEFASFQTFPFWYLEKKKKFYTMHLKKESFLFTYEVCIQTPTKFCDHRGRL